MNDMAAPAAISTPATSELPWTDASREGWKPMVKAIPRKLSCIEELEADGDGMIAGDVIEKTLADVLRVCGYDPTEWISARSLAAHATFDSRNRFPRDWRTVYRWLETGVVHGGSEGWIVHVRGIARERAEDGTEQSRLLLMAKLLNRHDAWRVAELFAHFFDC